MKKVGIILGVIAIGAISLAANTVTYSVTGTVSNNAPTLDWEVGSGTWDMGNLYAGVTATAIRAGGSIQQYFTLSGIPIGSAYTIQVQNITASQDSWRGLNNLGIYNNAQAGTPIVTITSGSNVPVTAFTGVTTLASTVSQFQGAWTTPVTPTLTGSIAIRLAFVGTVQA